MSRGKARISFKGSGYTRLISASFYGAQSYGDDFGDFLFAFLHTKSLLKRGNSKRKEFASEGSKFFSLRVDICLEMKHAY